jgi:hypothetical protein
MRGGPKSRPWLVPDSCSLIQQGEVRDAVPYHRKLKCYHVRRCAVGQMGRGKDAKAISGRIGESVELSRACGLPRRQGLLG